MDAYFDLHPERVDKKPVLLLHEAQKAELYGRKVHSVKKLLSKYLEYGSFSEVVLFRDNARILKEHLLVMITRDVADRNGIRNLALPGAVVKALLSSYSKYTSYSSIYRFLKSEFNTSKIAGKRKPERLLRRREGLNARTSQWSHGTRRRSSTRELSEYRSFRCGSSCLGFDHHSISPSMSLAFSWAFLRCSTVTLV